MRFFWKSVLANIVAIFITVLVTLMVCVVAFIICLRVMAGAASGVLHNEAVHANSVLVFDMDVAITDAPNRSSASDLLSNSGPSRLCLYDVVTAIDSAAADNHISALYLSGSLDTDNAASGYAALCEVRQALERFKASGKKIYAYLEEPTLKDYYLATVANEVSLNPFGYLTIDGLAAQSFFLRDALAKYGIGVQVTKVGKYKSFTEMFTETHMSDADREQLTQLLNGIWGTVSTDLAASRKIEPAAFQQLATAPGLYIAQDALKDKLVDRVAYLDEMIKELEGVGAYDEDNDTFYQVSLASYAKRLADKREAAAKSPFADSDKLAIVYAEGDIVDGGGSNDSVGGDQFAYDLRSIRGDKDVKAVVLRVNSPGGSAYASEIIQREMRNLLDKKIPVVVSMGTYAASGGYWISAYSDYIYAEPTTVTGSIGVFGLKLNLQQIATDHGIAFDTVKTAPYSDMDTLTRPWTPDEVKLAQTLVDSLYDQFITKVSDGRKLKYDDVAQIAQGRVWSGLDAKKNGLVNEIGGLGDAIKKAEQLGHLDGQHFTLEEFPERRSPIEALAETLSGNDDSSPVSKSSAPSLLAPQGRDALSTSLRQIETQMNFVRTFNDPSGMYARLPYLLNF
jgi:protease-4